MSLYYEAAALLANPSKTGGSLKSRIYKQNDLKSSPPQIFALVTETSKWSPVLKTVIERSGLLREERKLSPLLAILLTHDLLLSKNGVAAPANHVLKLAITRHKARLNAELTKSRLQHGCATLQALRQLVNDGLTTIGNTAVSKAQAHPRWVRINTLKTTLDEQLSSTFAGYVETTDLSVIMSASASSKTYLVDPNIPDILALPPKIDLSKSKAYTSGQIIFQDKASCFPAYLLDIGSLEGDVIDGCAAPGNKTTHLAAIISEFSVRASSQVIAFERDKLRAKTLDKMVKLASADQCVTTKAGHDFLAAKPSSDEFSHVTGILLDPSCSGSGIVGRDDTIDIQLPAASPTTSSSHNGSAKKRKRTGGENTDQQTSTTVALNVGDHPDDESPIEDTSSERLSALSAFQLRILIHAMEFPAARRITYSTCSIHFEENELVVFQALQSPIAKQRGWNIMKREQQVSGLKVWSRRGVWEDEKMNLDVEETLESQEEVLDACIRCDKGTDDGTMGFFVAAFVRHSAAAANEFHRREDDSAQPKNIPVVAEDEDEWNGFSDNDLIDNESHDKSTITSTGAKSTSRQGFESLRKVKKQKRKK